MVIFMFNVALKCELISELCAVRNRAERKCVDVNSFNFGWTKSNRQAFKQLPSLFLQ